MRSLHFQDLKLGKFGSLWGRRFSLCKSKGFLGFAVVVSLSVMTSLWFLYVGFGAFFFSSSKEDTFEDLAFRIFEQKMANDSLSQHFLLRNPGAYRLDSSAIALPVYSKEENAAVCMELENNLAALQSLADSQIPNAYAFDYEVLANSLRDELALNVAPFFYLHEPLSPAGGMQVQLPLLLAEYHFYERTNVENYLALLSCVPDYLEGLARFECEKSAQGLFMSSSAADKIIAQCTFFSCKDIPLSEHVLYTSFVQRLSDLYAKDLIDEQEYQAYLERHNQILRQEVFPAYQSLADTFTRLRDSGTNPSGLFYFPQGSTYYEALVRSLVGTDKSVSTIKELLSARFMDLVEYSTSMAWQEDEEEGGIGLSPFEDPLAKLTPAEILEDLKKRMAADFPMMADGGADFSYVVHDVEPSLEEYCPPAFYFTPPIDDFSQNVIYINHAVTSRGIDLYTTLAHEGFPGHLYQSVSYHLSASAGSPLPIRSLLYYGGYIEGYATYAEMLSYEYACACVRELADTEGAKDSGTEYHDASGARGAEGLTPAELYYQAVCNNKDLLLCLYSLLDILIHYEGMTLADVTVYLEGLGIADPDAIQDLYCYIVEEPCSYLKYYVGYLEILELKEVAKECRGEEYSDRWFHKVLLETGGAPFWMILERIYKSAS